MNYFYLKAKLSREIVTLIDELPLTLYLEQGYRIDLILSEGIPM